MTSLTLDQAEAAIVTRWLAEWTSTANTALEGEVFVPTKGVAYARLYVREEAGDAETQSTIGNRRFTRRGRVLVQVFFPDDNSGSKALSAAAVAGRSILEGKSIGGVDLFAASVRPIASDGEWLGRLIDVPFLYTEIK